MLFFLQMVIPRGVVYTQTAAEATLAFAPLVCMFQKGDWSDIVLISYTTL